MNEKIYEKAIKLLSIRLHTTGELHRKLKTRGFGDSDIREVLQKLEELKFLDDQRFAEIYVDNLKRFKDFGYFGIKAKLLARHIPSDMAEAALREFYTLEDELSVGQRFYQKQKKLGRKSHEQVMRSLQSKGFRGEVIRKVIQN